MILNIDLTYLEDITGGDKGMMLEMLDLFIEDIPIQVGLISKYANERNLSMLASEAHKLKPTLQYVGLISMYEAVKEIEEISKKGKFSSEIPTLTNTLTKGCEEAIPSIVEKRKEFI